MSYDIEMVVDTGGKYFASVTETLCPTYNLFDMFKLALGRPMREMEGLTGDQAIPILLEAHQRMLDNPAVFKKLNPPNGWGSYEGALETFAKWVEMCVDHPKAMVKV